MFLKFISVNFPKTSIKNARYLNTHFFSSNIDEPSLKEKLYSILSPFEATEEKNIYYNNIVVQKKIDAPSIRLSYNLQKINFCIYAFITSKVYGQNLFVTLVAGYLSSVQLFRLIKFYFYNKKMISKISLDWRKKNQVKIVYALWNKEESCYLKDFDLKEIEEIQVENKMNYILFFNVRLTNGEKIKNLKLNLDFNETQVKNYQLLKYIMTADVEQMKNMIKRRK